jgi:hypothetical protein
MAALADRHYSRRTIGKRQFMYSGRKLVLRNTRRVIVSIGPAGSSLRLQQVASIYWSR